MLIVIFVFMGILGCQTAPKPSVISPTDSSQNQIGKADQVVYLEGRMTIEDLEKKKTNNAKVEVFLQRDKKMRLEATGPMGIRIASIIVLENSIEAQLYLERKYMTGKFPDVWKRDQQSLRAVSIPVAPKFLQSIFLNEKNLGSQWKCEKENNTEECLNLNPKIPNLPEKMTWITTPDGKKMFFAESSRYRLRWEPQSDKSFVELKPKLFQMDINERFQKVEITPR